MAYANVYLFMYMHELIHEGTLKMIDDTTLTINRDWKRNWSLTLPGTLVA